MYEDDHFTEEEQDVDGESVLETQPKEQEHIDDKHSETEHEGEESESIDHYDGSAREKRSMSVDYEDEVVEVTFHNKGGKFLKKLWCCVGGSITR